MKQIGRGLQRGSWQSCPTSKSVLVTQVAGPRTQRAIAEEACDPSRIVNPEKEENFFVNLCYPTSIEMATSCNCIFV